MRVLHFARHLLTAFAILFLVSCSSMVVDGVSLSRLPQIQNAHTVAISQSPELLYISARSERFSGLILNASEAKHPLPGEAVAGGLLRCLPPGVKGKLVSFESPTQLPSTMAQRFLLGNTRNYARISPRRDADLMIILVPSAGSQSSGYYNAAAGAYIAGGSSYGGHYGTINTIGPSNVLSRLDALVFSCNDGSLIGETNVIATLNFKELSEAYVVTEMCSKSLAKTIFGVR